MIQSGGSGNASCGEGIISDSNESARRLCLSWGEGAAVERSKDSNVIYIAWIYIFESIFVSSKASGSAPRHDPHTDTAGLRGACMLAQ